MAAIRLLDDDPVKARVGFATIEEWEWERLRGGTGRQNGQVRGTGKSVPSSLLHKNVCK